MHTYTYIYKNKKTTNLIHQYGKKILHYLENTYKYSNKENIKKDTIKSFKLAIDSFNEIKSSKNPLKYLKGNNIEAVFKVR